MWGSLFLACVACAGVLWIPGALVSFGLRLRGLWFAASAPLLGVTTIVGSAIISPLISLAWTPLPVLGAAILAGGLLRLTTRWLPALRPRQGTATRTWVVPLGVTSGATLLAVQVLRAVGAPDNFAQSFDNVFHLNAVRYILDTSNASPLALGSMTSQPGETFAYPSGWHAVVSLVVQTAGVEIPVASNAALLTISCVVWPLGAMLLSRSLVGPNASVTLAAGVLSAAFATFPMFEIVIMGTYPLVFSIALLPASVAALAHLFGVARIPIGRGAAGLTLAATLPGITVAHPSSAIWLLVLSLPVFIVVSIARYQGSTAGLKRRLWLMSSILYTLLVVTALVYLQPDNDHDALAKGTLGQAIGEALSSSLGGLPVAVAVAVLALIGTVRAVRRGGLAAWTGVGLWGTSLAMYVIAAGGDELWRLALTGVWNSDADRIAAYAPLATLPLAALGAASIWVWAGAVLRRRKVGLRGGTCAGIAAAGIVLLAVATQGSAVRSVVDAAHVLFEPTDSAVTVMVAVSEDERAIIREVAKLVPKADVIAGNPWSGSSVTYALTGRRVLLPHLLDDPGAETTAFLEGFATATPGDPACRAARDLNVRWVLDFRSTQGTLPGATKYAGLENLATSPNVELVDRKGDAYLYKIVGCGV
ncbi:DUF6541 family protein [Microbacterium sp. AZCO]|uniref:DUF6541 family protein n=1 Tax=Microbacterium sp. AZCO TaxID=3142976 RepID=UPI0031F47693